MKTSEESAGGRNKPNEQKPKNAAGSGKLENKSPANIFLINKALNPMFGIPRKKNTETASAEIKNAEIKKLNDASIKTVKPDMKENRNELKLHTKIKRSVRRTGLITGGFNFVKDAMKKSRNKK